MLCAFIDESLSLSSEDDYFIAVAAVITDDRRRLELLARRLKRAPKLKAHSELKASASSSITATRFLQRMSKMDEISITASIWQGKRRSIEDYEILYQSVVARCALGAVRRYPKIDLIIDKRYTNPEQQRALEGSIREAIASVPHNIVRVFQEESHVAKGLAAPDFVAWALMEHYARGEGYFYNLIRSKIVHFDDLRR